MILPFGITEIIGKHSVGKTSLALYFVNSKSTLYISSSLFRHKAIPTNLTIIRIDTLMKLKILLASHSMFLKEFDYIIIDTLEEFFYVFNKQKKYLYELAKITKSLKSLIFKHNIKIIVTNYYYEKYKYKNYEIINNPYLGFGWSYAINTRFLITEKGKIKNAKQILGVSNIEFNFEITLSGIKLL